MCGVVGFVGGRPARTLVWSGLELVEHREILAIPAADAPADRVPQLRGPDVDHPRNLAKTVTVE